MHILLERNNLVLHPGWGFRLTFVFSLTICSMFVMWLGEQISLFGVGNGSSMIIFAGIVARLPIDLRRLGYEVMQGFVDWWVAIVILSFVCCYYWLYCISGTWRKKNPCSICSKNGWSKSFWWSKYLYSIQN